MEQPIPTRTVRRDLATPAALFLDSLGALSTAMGRVVELNVQTVNTSLLEQQALTDSVLSPQPTPESIELPMRLMPATVKKQLAYWRHLGEIVFQTHIELVGLVRDYSDPGSITAIWSNNDEPVSRSAVILPEAAAGIDNDAAGDGGDGSHEVIVDSSGHPVSRVGPDDVRH